MRGSSVRNWPVSYAQSDLNCIIREKETSYLIQAKLFWFSAMRHRNLKVRHSGDIDFSPGPSCQYPLVKTTQLQGRWKNFFLSPNYGETHWTAWNLGPTVFILFLSRFGKIYFSLLPILNTRQVEHLKMTTRFIHIPFSPPKPKIFYAIQEGYTVLVSSKLNFLSFLYANHGIIWEYRYYGVI